MPLAELMRPTHLNDVMGQRHLLDAGKPLRVALESNHVHSMILWGPPGVGKTTLAQLIAKALDCEWIALSAVFSGVKDIRAAVAMAEEHQRMMRKTILFIDEIHRFNKAQQDALLPYTESGLVTLIGATTENPAFEINRALLSRAQVYILHPLTPQDFEQLLQRAQQQLPAFSLNEQAKNFLFDYADGDARRFLNALEHVVSYAQCQSESNIDEALIQQILTTKIRRFDKTGDNFYDHISALHKSVRGSDPDAALYWLCRMFDGGVDINYLSRRIIRMAWEDIGLADPRAMQIANDAAMAYDRLGSPEGELALAQAVIYLSIAAKSNAGYKAFNQAMTFVKNDGSREVPLHLRNASTALVKDLGYGARYRYPHDEAHGIAAGECYFPENINNPAWYQPVDRGLEIKISEKMRWLRQLNQKKSK